MFLRFACFEDKNGLTYKYNSLTGTWVGLMNNESGTYTFAEAEQYCRSNGHHLLTLPTLETAQWMRFELTDPYQGNGELVCRASYCNAVFTNTPHMTASSICPVSLSSVHGLNVNELHLLTWGSLCCTVLFAKCRKTRMFGPNTFGGREHQAMTACSKACDGESSAHFNHVLNLDNPQLSLLSCLFIAGVGKRKRNVSIFCCIEKYGV